MLGIFSPPPAPPGFGKGKVLPQANASFPSRLVFQWLSPFLSVGYSRPLEKDDLWELPPRRLTHNLTDELETNFFNRCPPEHRPLTFLQQARNSTDTKDSSSAASGKGDGEQNVTSTDSKKYDSSLAKAVLYTFRWSIITSGILKLFAETLNTTTPLVSRVLLAWLQQSYRYYHATEAERATIPPPRGIGYGIGLAFAIFAMQESASLMLNHSMQSQFTSTTFLPFEIFINE
ncbi:hypothetical protein PM082_008512 [Marasmius tenuissimus]|nr:hypothetical protein PM082_008512 [Marasmius tenuissimus]